MILCCGCLIGVSPCQRKWDRAYGHKQNQVKCASDKMRFDSGINLFFHVGSLVKRSLSHFGCRLPIVYQEPSRNVNTIISKFPGFSERLNQEFAPRRGCGGKTCPDDVDYSGKRSPRGSPEGREQKLYTKLKPRFSHCCFHSINPGAIPLMRCVDRGEFPRDRPFGNSLVVVRYGGQSSSSAGTREFFVLASSLNIITDTSYGSPPRLARTSRLGLQDNQSK